MALGGTAGTRLTPRFGLPASRDTLLRLVHRVPLPVVPPLSAIGVDDWAYRKRQRYGTIVVDLEPPAGGAYPDRAPPRPAGL
jgi:hypothetical protein